MADIYCLQCGKLLELNPMTKRYKKVSDQSALTPVFTLKDRVYGYLFQELNINALGTVKIKFIL
jgi:hypothetical protein